MQNINSQNGIWSTCENEYWTGINQDQVFTKVHDYDIEAPYSDDALQNQSRVNLL